MVARFRASVARITFGSTLFSCLGVLEKTRFFFKKRIFVFGRGTVQNHKSIRHAARRRGRRPARHLDCVALCFSKNAKIANRATIQDSAILGGSKGHVFGLRARCENKWA